MEEKVSSVKNGYGQSFLLCQFQSLMGHIDNLISSSTMRIYSVLLIWAFSITALSIIFSIKPTSSKIYDIFIFSAGVFLFLVGSYMYHRQIISSINIVYYYRIINRIRKAYIEKYPEIEDILYGLPFSCKEPKNILRVFDPGIWLLPLLNAIALAFSLFIFLRHIFWLLIIFIFIFVIEILIWRILETRKLKTFKKDE